jgi:hypothetical protein
MLNSGDAGELRDKLAPPRGETGGKTFLALLRRLLCVSFADSEYIFSYLITKIGQARSLLTLS